MKAISILMLWIPLLIPNSPHEFRTEVYHLNPKIWPTQIIKLDQKVSDVKIISLETTAQCLIGSVGQIKITSDLIFVTDRKTKQVLCFDSKGHFLRKVGSVGKGPGEYLNISSILVDTKRSEIILNDNQSQKILFYTLDGKFLRSRNLQFRGPKMEFINNDLIAVHCGRMGYNSKQSELAAINMNGEIQTTFFPFSKPIWADAYCGFTKGTHSGSALYHKIFDYRIYEVYPDRVNTLLTLDFGHASIDSARYLNSENVIFAGDDKNIVPGINSLSNTPEHLIASISMGSSVRGVWILDHKSENHEFLAASDQNCIGTYKGLPLYLPGQSSGNWFVSSTDGINWFDRVNNISESEKIELRKEVSGFLNSEKVNIDGNPVLVLYRLKEF